MSSAIKSPNTSSPFLHHLTSSHSSPFLHHSPPSVSSASALEVPSDVALYHAHAPTPSQSSSAVIHTIRAPIHTVWSLVRRFDAPHIYKHFLKSCHVISGDGDVGTLRRVKVVSGLPAGSSEERLEILDDFRHVISFSVVGGDHRLSKYRSVTSLHRGGGGDDEEESTVVVESYVVDTPPGNTNDETCVFVDTIVKCNLMSLAQIAENLARSERRSEN